MFTLNNKKFFVHYNVIGNGRKQCRVTEVIVAELREKKEDALKVISTGTAQCSKRDNFQKEAGRKIALARAIKDFSQEERTEIWKKYFSRLETNKLSEETVN